MAQAKATPLGEAGAGCIGELTNYPSFAHHEASSQRAMLFLPRNMCSLFNLKIFHQLKRPKECWLLHRNRLTKLVAFYNWKASGWGKERGREKDEETIHVEWSVFRWSDWFKSDNFVSTLKKSPNRFLNMFASQSFLNKLEKQKWH